MAYDNLKLEKELYTTGKSFTDALESIDPSENYRGTPLEGLDAYQRQLKRFDIKVSGKDSDTISKFFQTSDASALFPEYVSRAVRQGLDEYDIVSPIIASTTEIDSLDYRAVESIIEDEVTYDELVEGSFIPEINVKLNSSLTPLSKRGRMLVASYEAIKFQKLDVFTVILKQIGSYIANCQFYDAVEMLAESDNEDSIAGETLVYSDLVDFWNSFAPYNLSTLIAGAEDVAQLLNMEEFRDANAGLNFHGTGTMITPLGANLIKAPNLKERGFIIGIDKNYAIEKVQAGGIITDFDKLIDRQLERATVSCIAGFSPIFKNATRKLVTYSG